MKVELENVKPMDIEKRSFEIITEEFGDTKLVPGTELIVKRCIHTSADFDYYLPHFKKLIPNEYKKMITLSAKLEEKGLNSQQAQMEAFYESIGAKH